MFIKSASTLDILCRCLLANHLKKEEKSKLIHILTSKNFDWASFFEYGSNHWLLPAASYILKEEVLLPSLPDQAERELVAIYQLNQNRNQRMQQQLKQVIKFLNQVNIKPLLLKGASYLLEPLAAVHQARMQSDLDLLIPRDSVDTAVEVLRNHGYNTTNFIPEGTEYHLGPLYKNEMPARVELHTLALSSSAGTLLTDDETWANVTMFKRFGLKYLVLVSEYRLLHQLLHTLIHSRDYFNERIDLRQMYDFVLFREHFYGTLNWDLIASKFTESKYQSAWVTYVHLAGSLFPSKHPALIKPSYEQRMYSKKINSKLTGSGSKKTIYNGLERASRLPQRLSSPVWYVDKLQNIFRSK